MEIKAELTENFVIMPIERLGGGGGDAGVEVNIELTESIFIIAIVVVVTC